MGCWTLASLFSLNPLLKSSNIQGLSTFLHHREGCMFKLGPQSQYIFTSGAIRTFCQKGALTHHLAPYDAWLDRFDPVILLVSILLLCVITFYRTVVRGCYSSFAKLWPFELLPGVCVTIATELRKRAVRTFFSCFHCDRIQNNTERPLYPWWLHSS